MNISLTIAGILCVSILGTLLHFTYRWSGRNPLIGLIAPVNESVWEHMKLLFFPMHLSIGKIQPCDIHGRVSFIDLFSAVYLFSAGIFYF